MSEVLVAFKMKIANRDRLKVWCATNRDSMQNVLNRILEQFLVGNEQEGTKKKPRAEVVVKQYFEVPNAFYLKLTEEEYNALREFHGPRFGHREFDEELVRISNFIPNSPKEIRNHAAYVNTWIDRIQTKAKQELPGVQGRKLTNAEVTTSVVKKILKEAGHEV